jgi:hypothetical protein
MAPSIKQKIYDLIDKIDNESTLNQVYELIYKKSSSKEGDLWNKLTPDQQKELLQNLEESDDPKNLIPNEEVKTINRKWL